MVIRAFRPDADGVTAKVEGGSDLVLERVDDAGLFAGELPGAELPLRYLLEVRYADSSYTLRDPYAFLPSLGDLDLHLLGEGRHEELYEKLGAHVRTLDGVAGHGVRRLGARRAVGQRRRRLQLLGRATASRCARSAAPGSGSCSCPTSARGSATSSRSAPGPASCR